jgi:prolyl oligopeptidase
MIEARKDDVVDDFYGTAVPDPYRWMEDPENPDTVAWSEAQADAAEAYLTALPERAAIHRRLSGLWDFPKFSAPQKKGSRYFFSKNDGLQNQAVLYGSVSLDAEPTVVIDPNTLSEDGTVALTNQTFNRDGTLLAYGTSRSGSDWQEIRVRDVATATDGPEVLARCKFSAIAWTRDGAGFFYNRYPDPGTASPEDEMYYSRVFWHAVGTPQSADTVIHERPDAKEIRFYPMLGEDGRYLLLNGVVGTETQNRLHYRDVEGDDDFVRLLDDADANYTPIEMVGNVLYLHTDRDAPRGRIIAIDLTQPEPEHWREIVPEGEDVIAFVEMIGGHLVVGFMHDAHHRLVLYTLDGALVREITLPTLGSIIELTGERDEAEMFIAFTSFLYPPTVFRYDSATDTLTPLHEPALSFDPSAYETTQVFYPSKDGTQVPMFLTHKKGLRLDETNPTLLYAYGGFNISLTPAFSVSRLVWLENGGVFAQANLRGGGEYGEAWHQAGMFEKKQNVFDDFIAAAEWLIANGYTSASRLAIQGGSNGGLLVAACLLQRPELYGAVLCMVPVTDMLRFQKFTAGRFWTVEYGNAEESAEAFRYLYAYSPLHNVKPGVAYPPTLVATADTDDRVVPSHAKKFTATLQAAHAGTTPIFLRLDRKAGHGLGKPTAKVIDEQTDLYAFLFDTFGIQIGDER